MKFFVHVKPGSKVDKVEEINENHFLIWTKEPAKEDKANESVLKMLAKFLGVPPSVLVLKKGRHFQEKIFEIE